MHIKWIVFEFWAGFGVWVHVCTWHRAVSPAPVTTAPISPAHISPTHVSTTALSPQCYLHKLSQFLSPLLHQEKKHPDYLPCSDDTHLSLFLLFLPPLLLVKLHFLPWGHIMQWWGPLPGLGRGSVMRGSSVRGRKSMGGPCPVGINVLNLNFFIFFLFAKH